jgi:hypothetical protein
MNEASPKIHSAFNLEHAALLAEITSTKKVKCPFQSHPAILLGALRKGEFVYNKELDEAEFEKTFFEEGNQLKELADDFHIFKYKWDRTDICARDEIGWFASHENFNQSFACNEMIEDALKLIDTGLKAAVEYRYKNDGGRRDNRPGLKAFVEEIQRSWKAQAPEVPFGDTFEGGLDGDDRIPVSAAAKLIVEAMKILDPRVNGRDCETAMRAIKEELRPLGGKNP